MALAGVAAVSFIGVSSANSVTNESTPRSRTAAVVVGRDCQFSSISASQFYGQRFGTSVCFHDLRSTTGSFSGARAYATEEQTRERFTSGSVKAGGVGKSLYDSLGVSKSATAKEIKMAYRLAARRLHPDVVPADQRIDATKAFLEMQNTYSILSDPQRRANYDLTLLVQSFQTTGSRSDPITMTPSYGYTSAPISSAGPYPSASDFSFKSRSWETDQCW